MRRVLVVLALASALSAGSATVASGEEEPPKLLGRCTVEQLDRQPFAEWFRTGYDDYSPNAAVLEALRRSGTGDVRVEVFFGTWCGDSRREVPRWLKVLDAMGLARDRVALIAVDNVDQAHKRSPGGEERGLEIYRVPTVIVRRGDAEIARFVEYPSLSVERDLLAILEGRPYRPSYASYPVIRRWLREGLLSDPNVSADGLADEIRHRVTGEGELGAAARVLRSRGDTAEAVRLLEVNCALHRDSPGCFARLAEARLEAGDREPARAAAERALRLGADAERVEELLDLLERTRAPSPGGRDEAVAPGR